MGETLDNSACNLFRVCPLAFWESYVAESTGLEKKPKTEYGPLDLGKRVHELLEEHYQNIRNLEESFCEVLYAPSPNSELESEAQVIMAGYKQHYPVEDFTVVDCERGFKVRLPESEHVYTGKIDLLVRHPNGSLSIIDHKTEKRTSRGNAPKAWAARDQATLYLWAAEQVYGEPISNFYVNVLRRPDAKNGPEFPERQKLERTKEQIILAVRDITLVMDTIADYRKRFAGQIWPANRESCIGKYGECEFLLPHTFGWSEEIRRIEYQAKTPYLDLVNISVVEPK